MTIQKAMEDYVTRGLKDIICKGVVAHATLTEEVKTSHISSLKTTEFENKDYPSALRTSAHVFRISTIKIIFFYAITRKSSMCTLIINAVYLISTLT